ncbi:hypothetical protein FOL47_008656 [Perkinsus chesapeaki]|uniref:Tubulin--tyrosine ligase-like protein 5 n=1 Tax=Perkinsus chesapeaki TaxID=330153 RepID=A0A7J6LCY9_PERCH|nr:hypothetical protein FOL47_008656 [Perkinsus chesapeaki]
MSNKWSFDELKSYMSDRDLDFDRMMADIEDVIIKTVISAEPQMATNLHRSTNYSSCQEMGAPVHQNIFEIYGFDIIVDANLRPWLLEVNVCPSFSSSSPLDKRIKSQLMADAFTLIGFWPFCKGPNGKMQAVCEGQWSPKVGSQRSSRASLLLELENLAQKRSRKRPLSSLTGADWSLIMDWYDEERRSGGFRRIFPTWANAEYYGSLLLTERSSNLLFRLWLAAGEGKVFNPRAEESEYKPEWVPSQSTLQNPREAVERYLSFLSLVLVNNDKRSSFNLADVTRNCQVVARLNNDAEILSKLTPLERMRAEAAERKYQRSIGADLKGARKLNFVAAAHRKQGESSVAEEVKGVSENISTALHFIMAFIGSYAFGYYFIRVFREYWDPTYRYLFGGFCCVLTLFVEAILFIVRDEKADLIAKNARMRAREKARQEAVEMRRYKEKLEEETRKAEEEPDELEDVSLRGALALLSAEQAYIETRRDSIPPNFNRRGHSGDLILELLPDLAMQAVVSGEDRRLRAQCSLYLERLQTGRWSAGGEAQVVDDDLCARLSRFGDRTILQEQASVDFLWGRADDLSDCLNSLTTTKFNALFTLHNLKYGVAESYAFADIANGLNNSIESNTCGFQLHELDVDLKGFIDAQIGQFSVVLDPLSTDEQLNILNQDMQAAPFHFGLLHEFNRLNDAHTRYITPFQAFYYVLPIRFNSRMDGDKQVITLELVNYASLYEVVYNSSILHKDGDIVTEIDGEPVLQWMQDMVSNDGPDAGVLQGMLQRLNTRFFVKDYVDRPTAISPPPTGPLEITFSDGSTETIHWLGRLTDYSKSVGRDIVNSRTYNIITNSNPAFDEALEFEVKLYPKRLETLWSAMRASMPPMDEEDAKLVKTIYDSSHQDGTSDDPLGELEVQSAAADGWVQDVGYRYTIIGDAVVVSVPSFVPVEALNSDRSLALALFVGFPRVQEYARQHGVTRLLFDVSSNGGGYGISVYALSWYLVGSKEQICSPVVRHMTETWRTWVSSFGVNYNQTIEKFFYENPLLGGNKNFIEERFEMLYDLLRYGKQHLGVQFDEERELSRLHDIEDRILSKRPVTRRAAAFKQFLEERLFLDRSTGIGQQLAPQYGWFLFDNTGIINRTTGEQFVPPLSQYQNVDLRHWGTPSNYSTPGMDAGCAFVMETMPNIVPSSYVKEYWSEVSFVTDGNCGSACSIFTQVLQLSGAATAFTFGSLADQPMDVASFGGGNILAYDDILPSLNMAGHLGNWATFGKSEWSQITKESWVNKPMPFPTSARASYTWNILLASQLGPNSMPRQFYKIPGHKHLNMWARNLSERSSIHEAIIEFKSWDSLKANPQFGDSGDCPAYHLTKEHASFSARGTLGHFVTMAVVLVLWSVH